MKCLWPCGLYPLGITEIPKLQNLLIWFQHSPLQKIYNRAPEREKAIRVSLECPFNLNQALWGFSLWNASFVCQRLFPVRVGHKTGQNQECGILVAVDLNGRTDLSTLRADYISFWVQLIQTNPGLVGTVRGSYCSNGLKRDQVDNSRCFAQWTFRASWPLARQL